MKIVRIAYLVVFPVILLSAAVRDGHCGKVNVGAGTKVNLILKAPITTKSEKAPDPAVIIEVASTDSLAGVEIFRKGNRIYGSVLKFDRPGHLGKPGSIRVRIDSVQTSKGMVIAVKPLTLSAEGKAKKLKAYLTLPFLGYGYFFVKGGHATIGEPGQILQVSTAKFEEIVF
jgi:hypothetical protein